MSFRVAIAAAYSEPNFSPSCHRCSKSGRLRRDQSPHQETSDFLCCSEENARLRRLAVALDLFLATFPLVASGIADLRSIEFRTGSEVRVRPRLRQLDAFRHRRMSAPQGRSLHFFLPFKSRPSDAVDAGPNNRTRQRTLRVQVHDAQRRRYRRVSDQRRRHGRTGGPGRPRDSSPAQPNLRAADAVERARPSMFSTRAVLQGPDRQGIHQAHSASVGIAPRSDGHEPGFQSDQAASLRIIAKSKP